MTQLNCNQLSATVGSDDPNMCSYSCSRCAFCGKAPEYTVNFKRKLTEVDFQPELSDLGKPIPRSWRDENEKELTVGGVYTEPFHFSLCLDCRDLLFELTSTIPIKQTIGQKLQQLNDTQDACNACLGLMKKRIKESTEKALKEFGKVYG